MNGRTASKATGFRSHKPSGFCTNREQLQVVIGIRHYSRLVLLDGSGVIAAARETVIIRDCARGKTMQPPPTDNHRVGVPTGRSTV